MNSGTHFASSPPFLRTSSVDATAAVPTVHTDPEKRDQCRSGSMQHQPRHATRGLVVNPQSEFQLTHLLQILRQSQKRGADAADLECTKHWCLIPARTGVRAGLGFGAIGGQGYRSETQDRRSSYSREGPEGAERQGSRAGNVRRNTPPKTKRDVLACLQACPL